MFCLLYIPSTDDFMETICKILQLNILIPSPDFSHFNLMFCANLGSHLYEDVPVIVRAQYIVSSVDCGIADLKLHETHNHIDFDSGS